MLTKKIEKELVFEIILFSVGVVAISLFYDNNLLLTAILLVVSLFGMKVWYKLHDSYFFITGAIIGPIGEIVAIYFGAWQYANPTFLGIPIWLPLFWGLAVVLIKRFSEIFVKIDMK